MHSHIFRNFSFNFYIVATWLMQKYCFENIHKTYIIKTQFKQQKSFLFPLIKREKTINNTILRTKSLHPFICIHTHIITHDKRELVCLYFAFYYNNKNYKTILHHTHAHKALEKINKRENNSKMMIINLSRIMQLEL